MGQACFTQEIPRTPRLAVSVINVNGSGLASYMRLLPSMQMFVTCGSQRGGALQAAPTYQVMNGSDDVALRQRVTRQLSTAMEEDVSSPLKSKSARTSMMSYLLPIQFPFVAYSSTSERD